VFSNGEIGSNGTKILFTVEVRKNVFFLLKKNDYYEEHIIIFLHDKPRITAVSQEQWDDEKSTSFVGLRTLSGRLDGNDYS
jgi:hypothetical protein